MKYKSYIIVSHRNGKRRAFTVERNKLLRGLKLGHTIAAAVGVMLLMCGMVVVGDHPAKVFQLTVLLGIGIFVVAGLICWCLGDRDDRK